MNSLTLKKLCHAISGLFFLLSFSLHAATMEEMLRLHTADTVGSITECRAVLGADEAKKIPAFILEMKGRVIEQSERMGKYDTELTYTPEHAEQPLITYRYIITFTISEGREHAEIDPASIIASMPSAPDREPALAAELRRNAYFDQNIGYIEITAFPSYLIRPEPGVSPVNMGVTYCRKINS